jgi:hypothetical protein
MLDLLCSVSNLREFVSDDCSAVQSYAGDRRGHAIHRLGA